MTVFAIATFVSAVLFGGMPMTTIAKGGVSDITERREVVVRSAEEWTRLWREHAGVDADPPAVDFDTHMVVAVFLGTRTTGGYGVEITEVELTAANVVVKYTETKPGPGAMLAQVMTSPFHLVSVTRNDGRVRFERTEKTGR